jgi:hypothetical protein
VRVFQDRSTSDSQRRTSGWPSTVTASAIKAVMPRNYIGGVSVAPMLVTRMMPYQDTTYVAKENMAQTTIRPLC